MKTMSASQFKVHALGILNEVAETGESVTVTKRGKPVAQVVPVEKPEERQVLGKLADVTVITGDIVSPLGPEMWEACR